MNEFESILMISTSIGKQLERFKSILIASTNIYLQLQQVQAYSN